MALPPQGTFSFPGVIAPIDGRYTCSHGVTPGRIILRAAFQSTPVLNVGDLSINYGGQSFLVRDCKVVEQVNYYDPDGGWISEYLLEDRRWRWRFGEIEGNYNFKIGAGKIDEDCEREPQKLAELLFEAMKEQRYDFSELPNGVRPEVLWVGANPALELERLADSLGCRVVYDPLTDTVKLRKGGQGAFLPVLNSIDNVGGNLVRPAVPSAIRVVGGISRVQAAVPLEPLMEDLDGELRDPTELSFVADLATDTGNQESNWFKDEGLDFSNITDQEQKKLAQKTMWRYWRPTGLQGEILQYLETSEADIEDVSLELNEEYEDDDGEKSKQGYVLGVFNVTGKPFEDINTSKNTSTTNGDVKFEGNVQIHNGHDFPYIVLSRPVWKWEDDANGNDSKAIPDELWLVCSFAVRNRNPQQTCSLHHYSYLHQLNNDTSVGPEVYTDESLVLRLTLEFNKDDLTHADSLVDNLFRDDVEPDAREFAESRARRYQTVEAGNATYQEFILVNLDGAIQSVTWSFGDAGATTEVFRNSEPDYIETKYERRLRLNEIKRKAGVS